MRPRRGELVVALVCAVVSLGGMNSAAASATARTVLREPLYEIAFVGPLTGSQQSEARNIEFGAKLAIRQANASGRLPFRLALSVYNTNADPQRRALVAHELVANPRVIAVVGPTTSLGVQVAGPILSPAHLAMVTPSATYPPLATSGWTNFFRVIPDDDVQGFADANFLVKTMGSRRLFVVDDASQYGTLLAKDVARQAGAAGATAIVQTAPATTQCQAGTGDASQYASVALSVLASQATALFYGGYYCDFGLLLDSLRNVGFHGVVMSDAGANSPALLNSVSSPSIANGVYLSCSCVSSTNAVFNAAFAALAHYSARGATMAPEAYNATNAIIRALRSLKKVSRPALLGALHRVSFNGVMGIVRFRANGNLDSSRAFVSQVQGPSIAPVGLM